MPQPVVDQCSVTVFLPCRQAHVHVSLSGEIDLTTRPLLGEALDRAAEAAPGAVYVDLAAVTFAGAALPNFLFELRQMLPRRSTIVLCRPAPPVQWVLRAADVSQIATIRHDAAACA